MPINYLIKYKNKVTNETYNDTNQD